MLQLSVIIVNYNVKHFVHQTLLSVERAAQGLDYEVFVVDNNSVDGSADYLPSLHPQVRYIWNQENHGFACANNQAIRQARGRYILLLNPDTIVGEQTLRQCIHLLDQRPDAGACGVRMLSADGRFAPESRRGIPTPFTALCKVTGLCSLFPRSRTLGRYYMQYLDPDRVNEIEVISGAFMMLRSSTLQQAGPLDEDYFMYGEDIDLSYRILQTGLKNLYLPATILHYKGESTQKYTYRYVRIFHEAMFIFFRKHFSHYNLLLALPIRAAILLKATLSYLRMRVRKLRQPSSAHCAEEGQPHFLRTARILYIPTEKHQEDTTTLNTFLQSRGLPPAIVHIPIAASAPNAASNTAPVQADYILFDAEHTPFDTMFRYLTCTADSDSRPLLATWYPTLSLLITPYSIVE